MGSERQPMGLAKCSAKAASIFRASKTVGLMRDPADSAPIPPPERPGSASERFPKQSKASTWRVRACAGSSPFDGSWP